MVTELLPQPAPPGERVTEPGAVVQAFLAYLAACDVHAASEYLAEDVLYVNVGLPSVRGRAKVVDAFKVMDRPSIDFDVYLHAIAVNASVVLTERTDVIIVGRMHTQFWVAGRFDVHDGQITLWRDAFDFVDIIRGTIRGALGALMPTLRPTPPSDLGVPPGR